MEEFTSFLGRTGVIFFIGILVFFAIYINSVQVFSLIERQTVGTRDYILSRLELMFIEFNPEKLTNMLLICSFGVGTGVIAFFSLLGNWKMGVILGPVFGFIGWKLPRPFVNFIYDRRVKKYQAQMVDGLNLLANGLAAGLSFNQALGMVVNELPAPISEEFNYILSQNKIGVPMEDCLETLVERIPLEDNQMFVSAVNILRETGGNLIEVFQTIIYVIRERIRVLQKIEALMAQSKTQATIMCLMPFVMTGIMYTMDSEGMKKALSHTYGILMILGAYVLTFIGGFVMIKMTKIKV